MKKFIKENWFKIIVIVILMIAVSAYVLGQFAYYKNQQAQIQLDEERQKEESRLREEKKINLENCLIKIEEETDRLFKLNFKNCQSESGIDWECSDMIEKGTDKMKKEGKEECFKKYPQ